MRLLLLGVLLAVAAFACKRDTATSVEELDRAQILIGFVVGQRMGAELCDVLAGGREFIALHRAIAKKFNPQIEAALATHRAHYRHTYGDQWEQKLTEVNRLIQVGVAQRVKVTPTFCHTYRTELDIQKQADWSYIATKLKYVERKTWGKER